MIRIAFAVALTVSCLNLRLAIADEAPRLQAGAAMVDITPSLGLPIVGGWDSPPATSIHDPLHVRCIVLDDGDTRIGFAICDNVGIPREVFDLARRLIEDQKLMPSQNVLMAATHTHSGVSARNTRYVEGEVILDNYQTLVAKRIAEGIAESVERLEPARIGWGSIEEASELNNRRWFVSDPTLLANPFGGVDKVRMNPPAGSEALIRPAGPIDPELSFISIQNANGKPLALLANYSLHYVGGVPNGDVSADYFGVFADKIADKIGAEEPFVGIMSNGTSGDVNNIRFTEKAPRKEPYEKINDVAEVIASRVADANAVITFHDSVVLSAASENLTLNMRKPDDSILSHFSQSESRSAKERHPHELTYSERVKALAEGPDTSTILLQALRIGDLGITAIPFEVFTETGLDLKARSPFADSFTIELANGSYGYLPTPAQHELGGYETWMGTNKVQLDASEKITDVLLRLMSNLNKASE